MKWTDQSPSNELTSLNAAIADASPIRTLAGHANDDDCLILINELVHEQVLIHLQSRTIEQGGLLIGVPFVSQPEISGTQKPSHVHIIQSIAAPMSSGTGYSLRMEGSVWSAANARLRELAVKFNGARIVGWYHSHPGLGAFFSATDMSTQAAFFRHPYSTGWVVDPSDDSHALFLGPDSQPVSGVLIRNPTKL